MYLCVCVCVCMYVYEGQYKVVGIVTHYGLGWSGDRIPLEARFSAFVHTDPGTNPASYTIGIRSFSGVNWPGRGVDHPPPSNAVVKERVELYLYSFPGPSRPVLWWSLPLPFIYSMYIYIYIYNVTTCIEQDYIAVSWLRCLALFISRFSLKINHLGFGRHKRRPLFCQEVNRQYF
jgi:hypothetical protein